MIIINYENKLFRPHPQARPVARDRKWLQTTNYEAVRRTSDLRGLRLFSTEDVVAVHLQGPTVVLYQPSLRAARRHRLAGQHRRLRRLGKRPERNFRRWGPADRKGVCRVEVAEVPQMQHRGPGYFADDQGRTGPGPEQPILHVDIKRYFPQSRALWVRAAQRNPATDEAHCWGQGAGCPLRPIPSKPEHACAACRACRACR